jgi:hypothetical protein
MPPDPGENPVTRGDEPIAVQEKVVFGTFEVNGMFVDSPEHIDLERGLLVTKGGGVTIS